ncbi:MAG TPA: tetratricopeptide repeat protein, partial [Myxococcota bacterium]|nr:tetratricopeptide repeat protein [Myxococcota bacterium]
EEAEELLWIHIDEAASLAMLQAESSSFRVHALIQSLVQQEAAARADQLEERLAGVLLDLLNRPPTGTTPKWVLLRPLLPHVRRLTRSLERPEQRRLLLRLAELDLEQGRPAAAIADLERLLPEAEAEEHVDIVQNLALAAGAAGNWRRARELAEGLLPLLADQAADSTERLQTEHIRAAALHHVGDQKAAEKLEEVVLAQRVQQWGAAHPDSEASLQNLSLSRLAQGETEAALTALRALNESAERELGPEHPETLLRLHNLALALHEAGETPEALERAQQAREGRGVALGADHPLTLSSLHNVACFKAALGDFSGAIQDYRDCLQQSEERLGPEHPQSLGTAQNLAATLQAQGDRTAARLLFENVLEIRTRVVGAEHPDRLMTL